MWCYSLLDPLGVSKGNNNIGRNHRQVTGVASQTEQSVFERFIFHHFSATSGLFVLLPS